GPFRDNGDVLSAAAADTANPQDDRYGSSVEADSALPKVYTLDEIVVTGSRIRGEPEIAAPLNIITREDLANTGFQTIEQVLESTPQNFAGVHPASFNGAVNATRYSILNTEHATGLDLRGLGPDSTLVLLNGKRRAAGGAEGRFVDISMIPLAAIERIEIVTGGGSALYGSDAVAGTVNYVTRRSFEGIQSEISYGGPTEYPGGQRLQTNHVLGHDFGRGSFMVAYDYRRDWTSDLIDMKFFPDDLSNIGQKFSDFPFQVDAQRHAVMASGRVALSDTAELYADLLHSQRESRLVQRSKFIGEANAGADDSSTRHNAQAVEYTASAGVKFREVVNDWAVDVNGVYSRVATPASIDTVLDLGFVRVDQADEVDRRSLVSSVSAVADGSLPALGAAVPRAAIGVEVREESLWRIQRIINSSGASERAADPARTVQSAFGELRLPLMESGTSRLGGLELTLGGRHDDYEDVGSIFNWMGGLIWKPLDSLTFRGTYATSFHAPAFMDTEALAIGGTELRQLADPARVDGNPSPVLFLSGSGPVTPEKAKTWTFSVDYVPSIAPWSSISLSYISIQYDNRIAAPMTTAERPLALQRESRFPDLVNRNPTIADVEAFLSRDSDGLVGNLSLYPTWDPATGAAGLLAAVPDLVLVDRRATNLSIETYRGVDLGIKGAVDSAAGRLSFGLNATYTLERDNAVTRLSPTFSALDEIGRPVNLRLRATGGWAKGPWSAHLYVNYVDRYRNTFTVPESTIGSWTTTDLTFRFSGMDSGGRGLLRTLDATLSVNNLLDESPPHVMTSPGEPLLSYDAANASPVGRYIMASLVKRW
ncbi:MAG TPA: TonB-dependent receptor, partial [Thermomicrobiales bacterium]|nr:TonB-dependent receptor [Thermomicrobiales bacterium]